MRSIVDTHEEAAALADPPLLIRRPLERYLDAHGIGSGPLEARRIGEGYSNATFLIVRGGAEVVLRRPPRPPYAPGAHDVLREARLLTAVEGQLRTPRVVLACPDEAVIGAPFYLMEKVEGYVPTTDLPAPLDATEERRRVAAELVDALAEVHAVDWRACGLEDYGRPTDYLERQLARMLKLWGLTKTRELDLIEDVARWLAGTRPESGPATIVHGDYRLGNTMFAPTAPARLLAILDWEMSTIGDPLADLGYLSATWPEPGDVDPGLIFDLSTVVLRPGFPTRAELVASYEERAHRSTRHIRWYQTLAIWKTAVLFEGMYKRLLASAPDDPFLQELEAGVPDLARRAWSISRGDRS